MAIDYREGRYIVYGASPEKPKVGWTDDGLVHSDIGTWSYRLDGDEIYGLGGDFVGTVEDGVAKTTAGHFLFSLERDD